MANRTFVCRYSVTNFQIPFGLRVTILLDLRADRPSCLTIHFEKSVSELFFPRSPVFSRCCAWAGMSSDGRAEAVRGGEAVVTFHGRVVASTHVLVVHAPDALEVARAKRRLISMCSAGVPPWYFSARTLCWLFGFERRSEKIEEITAKHFETFS